MTAEQLSGEGTALLRSGARRFSRALFLWVVEVLVLVGHVEVAFAPSQTKSEQEA